MQNQHYTDDNYVVSVGTICRFTVPFRPPRPHRVYVNDMENCVRFVHPFDDGAVTRLVHLSRRAAIRFGRKISRTVDKRRATLIGAIDTMKNRSARTGVSSDDFDRVHSTGCRHSTGGSSDCFGARDINQRWPAKCFLFGVFYSSLLRCRAKVLGYVALRITR